MVPDELHVRMIKRRMENKLNLFGLTPEQIEIELAALGEKPFRAKQVCAWLFDRHIADFTEMTDLSIALRERLAEKYSLNLPVVIQELHSKDGSSKFLLQLEDSSQIEMVLMPGEEKMTLCVSSQVGCARQCQFCATATIGLQRNLTVAEIIGQIIVAQRAYPDKKLTNLVFMGMGEPLDNYENLVQALRIMESPRGLHFSPRRVTVSTSGVVPRMQDLADSGIKVKLAVSLNAATDAKRDIIMPINKKYPLDTLKKAIRSFRDKTAFRVTIEYIMIKNFNMDTDDIRALRRFAGDLSCKLNLIAWNPVAGLPYQAPSPSEVETFQKALYDLPVAVMLRQSRGADIAGACGQLVTGR